MWVDIQSQVSIATAVTTKSIYLYIQGIPKPMFNMNTFKPKNTFVFKSNIVFFNAALNTV